MSARDRGKDDLYSRGYELGLERAIHLLTTQQDAEQVKYLLQQELVEGRRLRKKAVRQNSGTAKGDTSW